jgi:hypothetical protein
VTIKPSDTLSLRIQTASLHELLEMRRVAARHGADIRTLRISMGFFSVHERWIELSGSLQYIDYRPINWDALLALLPSLRRLDLSEMPLTSLHVRKILEAASTCCNELEALVLPTKVTKSGVKDEVEPLLRVLSEAMKKWGTRDIRPGLRQLTVAYHSSALLAQVVLPDCPGLIELDLALCHVKGSSAVLGSYFIGSLAVRCPLLRRFTVRNVYLGNTSSMAPARSAITDPGLVALSQLGSLSDFQMRVSTVTGASLFKLLEGLSTKPPQSLLVEVVLVGPRSTEPLLEAFRTLMERLEATSPDNLGFANSNFRLRVVKGNIYGHIENERSRQNLRAVKPLVARVKAKYPELRIRLAMEGLREKTINNPRHFWLYTTSSTCTFPRN